MSVHIYVSPAGSGKSAYALQLVRSSSAELKSSPIVCVPTGVQVQAWRRRLARAGAIGVHVWTFDQLCAACLSAAGEAYAELPDPVQYRLLRAVVSDARLDHYAPLVDRPGFVQALQELIAELKAARVAPQTFVHAVEAMGSGLRLGELAQVYARYQERLQAEGWADRAGIAWLALESLKERAATACGSWPLLIVDGFDDLSELQLGLLRLLSERVGQVIITVTGDLKDPTRLFVYDRFRKTSGRLERALGVAAEPLPEQRAGSAVALEHLVENLYRSSVQRIPASGAIDLVEASDRATEVRSSLRWLKDRVLGDHMRLSEVALVARDIVPYRALILQTAAEFGLPVRLVAGLPLSSNPAISALLDLLRCAAPQDPNNRDPSLPRRLVVEAWRSPYFDWSARANEEASDPIDIRPEDADALDAVGRWGRVIGGLEQWREALTALAARGRSPDGEEEWALPARIPVGGAARALLAKFECFVERISPPLKACSYRDLVGWLETIIGEDPRTHRRGYPSQPEPTSLGMLRGVLASAEASDRLAGLAERDVAALHALKDVLRGLVWAEEVVGPGPALDLAAFLAELEGAAEAASYRLPLHVDREEILASDLVQMRGLPLRALAMLGMAEGEFPARLTEDPFLRNSDRQRLCAEFGLPLEVPTESAEVEFFYETLARPRERLLLTRPRLADNGADWQPSAFWEELLRCVQVQPKRAGGEDVPTGGLIASWSELMENLAEPVGCSGLREWVRKADPGRLESFEAAAALLGERRGSQNSPNDGDLTILADEFGASYGPHRPWSCSRLEAYASCPYRFFVSSVLHLEPRVEPEEGLDSRQLGNIYHRILEQVYQSPEVEDRMDLGQLLAALPEAAQRVLDKAPAMEGFRASRWWAQTRAEIRENVRRSLEVLHANAQERYEPIGFEISFGRPDHLLWLNSEDGSDRFALRGTIDRVDRSPDGRLRVIDYKTSSPSGFNNAALTDGKKLQLALYALAARDALHLGEVADGFYWHLKHAERSSLTLLGFREAGGRSATEVAVQRAWEVVRNVRRGLFTPVPPKDGCPPYCPAASFCWRCEPGYRA